MRLDGLCGVMKDDVGKKLSVFKNAIKDIICYIVVMCNEMKEGID